MQPGSQEKPTLPAWTSALWGNEGKNAHFNFFLYLELYFLQCTSPLLPFGPAKGLWAGRQPLWVSAAGQAQELLPEPAFHPC